MRYYYCYSYPQKEFLKNNSSIEKIIFIDINRDIIDLYKKELV